MNTIEIILKFVLPILTALIGVVIGPYIKDKLSGSEKKNRQILENLDVVDKEFTLIKSLRDRIELLEVKALQYEHAISDNHQMFMEISNEIRHLKIIIHELNTLSDDELKLLENRVHKVELILKNE